MQVKKYTGRTEAEALQKIRRELGPDAVILESHFAVRTAWFGLRRSRHVEIWAGSGFGIVRDYGASKSTTQLKAAAAYGAAPKVAAPAADTERILAEIGGLKKLVVETRERLTHQEIAHLGDELLDEYLTLTSAAVSEQLAGELVERIQKELTYDESRDRKLVREAIRRAVKTSIRCADGITFTPGRCSRVAFIGPTGVGKTTTIAKLMSIYAYRGKDVGIITCDTQRIAAADQIRRVAELVGVPVRVARLPEDARRAVEEFSAFDLVLIDTAGRGQRNDARMKELGVMLQAFDPTEIHLVVSLTAERETVRDVAERFGAFNFNRIVVTKVDETVKNGIILDVLARLGKELSFITTGQEIPRDIEVADSDRLASIILGEVEQP